MRRLKHPPSLQALDVEPGAKRSTSKRSPRRSNPQAVATATKHAELMVSAFQEGNRHAFDTAECRELVGLYAVLHEKVYGVAPAELVRDWMLVVTATRRMLKQEFEGRPPRMVAFIRWVWSREAKREAKRRQNGADSSRIGWRLQFQSQSMLTDYRVHLSRKYGKVSQ